ncbi:hypothetical protein [Ramlibacter sp. PS4R-6]|uniref:hypothetical protein n=1 Tax=Ramlibacter sp. PS4R-6 TaxID=3133438 RepID=UPI00309B5D51
MAQGAAPGRTASNVQPRFILAAAMVALLAACGGGGGGTGEAPLAATTAAQVAAPAGTQAPGATPASPTPAPTAAPAQAVGVSVAAADVANTTLAGNQSIRNVSALAGGGYAVTWSAAAGLFVQRYDAQGAKAGSETPIAGASPDAAAAVLPDGTVVTASSEARGIVVRRGDGSEAVVATGAGVRQPVLLALDDGGIAVGWAQMHPGNVQSQHAQRLDAQLRANGAPVDFAAGGAEQNVSLTLVAAPGGTFVAGVTHRWQGIGYVQYRIAGRDVGALADANAGLPEFNTSLAPLADGRFALWSMGSGGAYLQLLDASGGASGAPVRLAAAPETGVALADGGWVTVTRQMYGLPSLAQRFDASGNAVGAAVDAASGMSRPLVASRVGSGFALAWNFTGAMGDSDVRTQRIAAP